MRIEREDVLQGSLGDCGFIAAILSLVGLGMQMELQSALIRSGNTLEARFRFPVQQLSFANSDPGWTYRVDVVKIDDTLPRSTLSEQELRDSGCQLYMAARPGFAFPHALFVPLLEKAWAKYTDAHPDILRSEETRNANGVGYLGIVATDPSLALQALTGLQATEIRRMKNGLDQAFARAIVVCLISGRPCVLQTPVAGKVNGLGRRTPEGVSVNTNTVFTTQFDVTEKATGRAITFVGNHAYGLDVEKSDFAGKSLEEAEVVVINPWGFNCNTKGEFVNDANLRIRLSTLALVMTAVWTVQTPG